MNRLDAITLAFTVVITKLLITLGGCYVDKHPPPPAPVSVAETKDASP